MKKSRKNKQFNLPTARALRTEVRESRFDPLWKKDRKEKHQSITEKLGLDKKEN